MLCRGKVWINRTWQLLSPVFWEIDDCLYIVLYHVSKKNTRKNMKREKILHLEQTNQHNFSDFSPLGVSGVAWLCRCFSDMSGGEREGLLY